MITANQWYNIAKTGTAGSKTGLRIEFGGYYVLLVVSVDYGSASIAATESNINPDDITISARIRYNSGTWYADIRISKALEETISAAVYNNHGWESIAVNTSTAGSTICIINDVASQIRPSNGGGESLWERINVGTTEEPQYALIPKEYNGYKPGIITRTFITFGGLGSGPGESSTQGATILDGLNDVAVTNPTDGQFLVYDKASGLWINKSVNTGLDEGELAKYLVTNNYIQQQYVDDTASDILEYIDTAIAPLNKILNWLYLDEENNAVRIKGDYNFIVPGAISFGGAGQSSGGGAGLTQVTIKLGSTEYTSVGGVVSLPAYPVVPTALSAFDNDTGYATISQVDSKIANLVNAAPETLDTLGEIATQIQANIGVLDVLTQSITTNKSNISTLQGYFTDGAANNALRLGGQLPAYYATASALSTHISAYNTFKTTTENRLTALEALWYFDENNNAVRTALNLIVEKAISFGGAGQSSGGGAGLTQVTIKLGSTEYTSVGGVVSLPAYPVVPTALKSPYALTFGSKTYDGSAAKTILASDLGLGSVAYRETWNNFIHNTNEFTFVPGGYSSYIWINLRTASGTYDGAITEYRFASGSGGGLYAGLRSAKYIVHNGTSSQFLKADGSLDSTAYLPLSGGTMTGDIILPDGKLIRQNVSNGSALIGVISNAVLVGTVDNPLKLRSNGIATIDNNTLIHSGNIGSQSVSYASSAGNAGKVGGLSVTIGNNKPWGTIPAITAEGWMDVGKQLEFHFDNTTGSDFSTILRCAGNYSNLVNLPSESGTLALLTSNVASATKLQTARTIWGQSFNGSANVSGEMNNVGTIQPLKNATYSLGSVGNIWNYICGNYFTNNNTNGFFIGSRIGIGATDGGALIYCYGATPISLYTGGERMRILGNGRILMGTTTDRGDRTLQVQGQIASYNSNADAGFRATGSSYELFFGIGSGNINRGIYDDTYAAWWIYRDSTTNTLIPIGNVGIGTYEPAYRLDVAGTIRATSRIYANEWIEFGGTAGLYFPNSGAGSNIYPNTISTYGGFVVTGAKGGYCGFHLGPTSAYLTVMSNVEDQGLYNQDKGRWVIYYNRLLNTIGIGTPSNQSGYLVTLGGATYVGGNFVATGAITFGAASDRRLKSNVKPLTYRNTMRVLHKLRPVSFRWNETAIKLDSTRQGLCDGFIADEYEDLIPNSGRDIWGEYRAIDYTRAIPYLTMGWQIHESELQKMRKKVKAIERRIAHLEKLLAEHNILAA